RLRATSGVRHRSMGSKTRSRTAVGISAFMSRSYLRAGRSERAPEGAHKAVLDSSAARILQCTASSSPVCEPMSMPIIEANGLSKFYRVFQKKDGLLGALRGLVRREYKEVRAVDD